MWMPGMMINKLTVANKFMTLLPDSNPIRYKYGSFCSKEILDTSSPVSGFSSNDKNSKSNKLKFSPLMKLMMSMGKYAPTKGSSKRSWTALSILRELWGEELLNTAVAKFIAIPTPKTAVIPFWAFLIFSGISPTIHLSLEEFGT